MNPQQQVDESVTNFIKRFINIAESVRTFPNEELATNFN